jgi:cytochrome c peroxidase
MTGPPASSVVFRFAHRLGWVGVCIVLAGVAAAQAPLRLAVSSQEKPVADQEPIKPVPPPPEADLSKLALGARLYDDTRLSHDGSLSCQSCHDIRTNGASKRRPHGGLDTLTVFNASLNFRLNWEGNFRSLSAQAESSLENPVNLNTSVAEVIGKLNADPEMVSKFRDAYGRAPDRDSFLDALVTFERSLVTPNSRFDRWLGGDTSALSTGELEGYRLFKSLGCSSCHQGVNVGGNLFERQGIFHPLVKGQPETVRVPSLRNVATTAPYFHDGSAATLEDAVRRMAAAQLDRSLTDQQVESIVTFLRTLTGNFGGSPVVEAPP